MNLRYLILPALQKVISVFARKTLNKVFLEMNVQCISSLFKLPKIPGKQCGEGLARELGVKIFVCEWPMHANFCCEMSWYMSKVTAFSLQYVIRFQT